MTAHQRIRERHFTGQRLVVAVVVVEDGGARAWPARVHRGREPHHTAGADRFDVHPSRCRSRWGDGGH